MIALVYVALIFAVLLPYSIFVGAYEKRVNISLVMSELRNVSLKLSETSPEKEKKLRLLRTRYKKLRGALNKFMIVNMVMIWVGVFTALVIVRSAVLYISRWLGVNPLPPSPIDLPGISLNGYLNDLFLFLAAVAAYQPLHTKLSGMYKMRRSEDSSY